MRMLLVANAEDLRRTWRDWFAARGWDVDEARDIKSAVDLAIKHQPQAIVTEMKPEGANGYQFVRTFRTLITHDVKVVGIVAAAQVILDDANDAGFDLIVDTTIDLELVHEHVSPAAPDMEQRATTKMPLLKREP